MAAILAAILDFGYLQKSKHLNIVSGRFLISQNIFGYLTCVSIVYGKEVMVKIRKWRPFWTPSWILKNANKGFLGTFYQWFYTYSLTYPEKISLLPKMSTFWALWANTTGLNYSFRIKEMRNKVSFTPTIEFLTLLILIKNSCSKT